MSNLKIKKMAKSLYRKNLEKNEQEIELELLDFKEEEALQQINADILATKKSINRCKQAIMKAESEFPFSSEKIIKAELEKEGYEAGLKRLQSIKKRLFGEEKSAEKSN